MTKIDPKQEQKQLYAPSAKAVSVVDVPSMHYLMIDGSGNPNTALAYSEAVEALYAVAYALKFKVKKSADGVDFVVLPLEGLWWAEDMRTFQGESRDKDAWQWTMMIMQPAYVTQTLFGETVEEVQKKKKLPALAKLRFALYAEGKSVQIMHVGSYDDEGPTMAKLFAFIDENGYKMSGKHHEIYLGDPRKSASEKLRTILREPVMRNDN